MSATNESTFDARSISIGSSDDDSTLTLRVQGDEMYPEIRAGNVVTVEPCGRIKGGGGLYMIELDGHQMLQHVQRLPGRRLRLSSYNDDFEDVEIHQQNDHWETQCGRRVAFTVIGRYTGVVKTH